MAQSTTPKSAKPKAATRKPAARKAKPAAAAAKPKAAASNGADAKAKFSKAIEDARAGAQSLAKDAQARSEAYREKLASTGAEWAEEAKVLGEQAKVRAAALAKDGKTRTSDAISNLGKVVADNAGTIDEKLGTRYGDYARTAARSMQETAARLDAKDLDELGEDARQFVRKSPGLAIGVAAVAGFMLARLFRGGSDD